MTNLEISISVHRQNHADEQIPNSELFNIRREIANMMNRSGFGDVIEIEGFYFANQFALPVVDVYQLNQMGLFVTYEFALPLEPGHGDVGYLATHGVQEFQHFSEEHNYTSTIRITFN